MSQPTLHDLKARLDQLLDDADISNRDTTEDKRAFDETKRNFRSAGPEILAAATEHLWAYYRDVAAEFEPADRAEYGIPELEEAADIWAEVTITEPPALTAGRTPLEPASAYLLFEGEVTWEDEHGLTRGGSGGTGRRCVDLRRRRGAPTIRSRGARRRSHGWTRPGDEGGHRRLFDH